MIYPKLNFGILYCRYATIFLGGENYCPRKMLSEQSPKQQNKYFNYLRINTRNVYYKVLFKYAHELLNP